MSITIDLPMELEGRLRTIPDLDVRIAEFLRNQARLEDWRNERYSAKAQGIVSKAMSEAACLQKNRVSREQAFRELREVQDEISQTL